MKSHFSNTHIMRNTCTDILVEENIALVVVVDSMQLGRMESKAEAGRQDLFEQPNYMLA
jgi:hypothetical protein